MPRVPALRCPDCDRRFAGDSNLRRHRTIAGDRYRCQTDAVLRERGWWRDTDLTWHRPAPEQASLLEGSGSPQPAEAIAIAESPARALARVSDPDTSHLAARSLSGKAGTMRRRILEVYATGAELNADTASFNAGFGPADGPWKRISDLLNAGLLEDTGHRRPGHSGRQQRVLRISEAGRRALLGVAS